MKCYFLCFFFFSSRRRHTRFSRDWSSDVCSSDLVVLMDVNMPELDGLEASRRIRAAEHERECRRTPIIALTANTFAEDREACLAAGMDSFLAKPLDRERLA